MEERDAPTEDLSQIRVTALLAQYREASAHHLLSNTLIWQLPAVTITVSGILVAAMFAYEVPNIARALAALAGALFVFAMTVAVERYRMLQLQRRKNMAEIEQRLAPLGISQIPWAAAQVVQEIDAGQLDTGFMVLYRVDGFNQLRALMYAMTVLLTSLAAVALLDAFGAELIS
jgi:flagellar motor component MotA